MTSKKTNISKRKWRLLFYCYFTSLITAMVLILVLTASNSDEFSLDNARYFYSAVFQGFAALLALVITAILITLQNINSQIYNTEERIYKILGRRFPTYIPGTIKEIKQDMDKLSFHPDFLTCVKENSKLSPEKQRSLVDRITDELNSMFNYIYYLKNYKFRLHNFFALSTLFSMVILFYSATALIFVGSDDVLGVSHFDILFGGLFLVMITIVFFVLYLLEIIQAWNIQPENSLKNHKNES